MVDLQVTKLRNGANNLGYSSKEEIFTTYISKRRPTERNGALPLAPAP